MRTVHVLLHGLPLCGFTKDVPRDWPDGHVWIHREHITDPEAKKDACKPCFDKAE